MKSGLNTVDDCVLISNSVFASNTAIVVVVHGCVDEAWKIQFNLSVHCDCVNAVFMTITANKLLNQLKITKVSHTFRYDVNELFI